MDHERTETVQQAPIDDSSSVVLHARKTVFVMLLVSALVVVGILVEDVTRLNRAVQDAAIVTGLMSLWHSETRNKDPAVSFPDIIAGPPAEVFDSESAFELQLVESDENGSENPVVCSVDLDLNQRFFVPKAGPIRKVVVVETISGVEAGVEIKAVWRNYLGDFEFDQWILKRVPYDLADFAELWDLLVSSRQSARIDASNLGNRLKDGILPVTASSSVPDLGDFGITPVLMFLGRYMIDDVTVATDRTDAGASETYIAPIDEYVLAPTIPGSPSIPAFLKFGFVENSEEWNTRLRDWKTARFDTAAFTSCRSANRSAFGRFHVIFPVKLQKVHFDWTKKWIERAIRKGHLSEDLLPRIKDKVQLPFGEAFSDLHGEAEGLESLKLDALHGWLQGRLEREGQSIEVASIGMPRHLLRSLGLLLILIVQGYAARHVSEAASRMECSRDGDAGAFQAWIILYDGLSSQFAMLCILAAPTVAAGAIFFHLELDGPLTANSSLGGVACLVSLLLTTYCIRDARRLRAAARRHRMSSALDRADRSS